VLPLKYIFLKKGGKSSLHWLMITTLQGVFTRKDKKIRAQTIQLHVKQDYMQHQCSTNPITKTGSQTG
jgi:hypothetical protein